MVSLGAHFDSPGDFWTTINMHTSYRFDSYGQCFVILGVTNLIMIRKTQDYFKITTMIKASIYRKTTNWECKFDTKEVHGNKSNSNSTDGPGLETPKGGA